MTTLHRLTHAYAARPLERVPYADQWRNTAEMKVRQSSKIRELGDALIAEGFFTLDQHAKALGLGRSTTWVMLKANHKASGLSTTVINRMLAAPRLPPLVRAKILEYIDEKAAGLYGHSSTQVRRFTARLSVRPDNRTGTKVDRVYPKLVAIVDQELQ